MQPRSEQPVEQDTGPADATDAAFDILGDIWHFWRRLLGHSGAGKSSGDVPVAGRSGTTDPADACAPPHGADAADTDDWLDWD